MYDLIIFGAGPAGMTAGIYAARREMKTLIIGQEIGGQVMWATEIENYPGFKSIQAYELISRMKEQVEGLGISINNSEVKKIEKKEDYFEVYTEKEKLEAKTIVIAMGLKPNRLEIPGEKEFNGKGVTYCANCDGPFYRNKVVCVVGGGNSALDAAEVLSKIASQVFLIHRSDKFRCFETLLNEVRKRDNIKILENTTITKIAGTTKVEKISIKNCLTSAEEEIALDGVFIEIGRTAHTDLVGDLVLRDKRNQIIIDTNGRTSTPGVFAAGDVTTVEFKQISVAVGSATIAALSAYQFLQMKEGKSGIVLDRSLPKKN